MQIKWALYGIIFWQNHHIFQHEEYKRARIEQETKNEVRSRKKFQTKASNSTWESQQNELINNQQNHLT